jgi:hypothetical protein
VQIKSQSGAIEKQAQRDERITSFVNSRFPRLAEDKDLVRLETVLLDFERLNL